MFSRYNVYHIYHLNSKVISDEENEENSHI